MGSQRALAYSTLSVRGDGSGEIAADLSRHKIRDKKNFIIEFEVKRRLGLSFPGVRKTSLDRCSKLKRVKGTPDGFSQRTKSGE